MATRSSTPPASAPPAEVKRPRPDRLARWALPIALLALAITFAVTVVRVLSDVEDSFRYGGDQAMAGLAVDEASHLDRLLGPYSRYGWSHPGPIWFYLLAPAYRIFGGDDAALIAANVLLNGLLAVAVVVAVHRAGRPALTLTVTALLMVLVLRLPPFLLVDVWSPHALLMGTLLFLVLAARVHSGSWSALLAMLLSGSFLVQTHVGTAPLVAIVGAAGAVAFFLGRRSLRGAHLAPDDPDDPDGAEPARARRPWGTVALAVLLVAAWIPPVIEQLSSPLREGNLFRLLSFFRDPGAEADGAGQGPTLLQAPAAVGRVLGMTPYGWDTGPLEMHVGGMPASVALVLAAQVLASVGLVVLGRRWGSRSGLSWGVVTLGALAAAIIAADTVTGVLYWYLIIWVAVLPVATLIGVAHLALDRRTADTGAAPARAARLHQTPVLAALAVVVLAGSVAAAAALDDAVQDVPASTEVSTAFALVDDALADVPGREVHVDMDPHELWPLGAGVVRGLVSEGWTVTVDPEFTELFGSRRAQAHGGPVDLILVATDGPEHSRLKAEAGVREVGALETQFGWVTLLLRTDG